MIPSHMIDPASSQVPKPNHDPLTGLGDRKVLVEFLTKAIAQSERRRKRVAVISISLSELDQIRARCGDELADQVLVVAARRIHTAIRDADLASRVGPEEFAVVAQEIDGRSGAETMVRRILVSICEPIVAQEKLFTLGSGIGVAIYPLHGSEAMELIQVAEKAMFQARDRSETDFTILE